MRRFLLIGAAVAASCVNGSALAEQPIVLSNGRVQISVAMEGARYSFMQGTDTIVGAAPVAGILIDGSPVTLESHEACSHSNCMLHGRTTRGATLTLDVEMRANEAVLAAEVQPAGAEVRFVTAGAAPAYGLADHAVEQRQFSTDHKPFYDTEVSGFTDDEFLSGQGLTRLVSNFVIYPRQQFAELLIDPTAKIVHTSAKEIVQGVKHAEGELRLYYFFGDPHQIYAAYREARNAAGYRIWMPKYEALGVGWEAFGALGWNTNAKTDQESIDRYLKEGYPLRWAVIGSGFWPSKPETMHETTSFGLWDKAKYPDPAALIQHLHDEKLTVMLGLRITFIVGGPYSDEGVAKGYFLKEDGRARIYRGGWPHSPYYLLDAHNPQALDWYMSLVKKWQDYGIGGWKEDFYGYGGSGLRDDKVDPTNDRLMAQKQLVIERNGYLSSNGDLHRINDFNYDQDQDRGPVNALAFAYSGFPLVYPDIVGGTFGESRFNTQRTERMQVYVARNAQWAAMHSSMGMGEPPWSFSASTAKVMLQAAKLHERIAPYLFSNARRFYEDGYPWTMTPLPIAFPNDPKAYGRENEKDRAYEWMIGDSILATPLYGGDFDTAKGRDVYLPAGEWMDFDTGKLYDGDQMLRGYSLPIGKTPMFIGGPGVTLEAIDGVNRICIYPVSLQATTTITLPGSDRPIRVAVQGLRLGMTWRSVEVVDGEGRAVAVRREGHGFSFVPAAAASYRVIAKP